MEQTVQTVIGTRNNGTKIVRNQIISKERNDHNVEAHKQFIKEDRIKAKAEHLNLKRSNPFIFNEQRNNFLMAIVEATEINLNIARVHLV